MSQLRIKSSNQICHSFHQNVNTTSDGYTYVMILHPERPMGKRAEFCTVRNSNLEKFAEDAA